MKILYFTGTGNCLSVAKRFDAEMLSIPQLSFNLVSINLPKQNLIIKINCKKFVMSL